MHTEVHCWIMTVLSHLVVRCHCACHHVIESTDRYAAILDSCEQVGAPVRIFGQDWIRSAIAHAVRNKARHINIGAGEC